MEKDKIYSGTSPLEHLYSVDTKFGLEGKLRHKTLRLLKKGHLCLGEKDALSQGPETRF